VLSTIAGFGHVDGVMITAARAMGASGFQLFRFVLLPGALPVILTGMRMGFTVALLSIIGSETLASLAGLGHHIVELSEGMEMARMFAYIAFVVAIATTLNVIVSKLEAWGRRQGWRDHAPRIVTAPWWRLGVIAILLAIWEIAGRWFVDRSSWRRPAGDGDRAGVRHQGRAAPWIT
jgi:ABC-type nitrate/sulfonate/bicarbonate transport system permease component